MLEEKFLVRSDVGEAKVEYGDGGHGFFIDPTVKFLVVNFNFN